MGKSGNSQRGVLHAPVAYVAAGSMRKLDQRPERPRRRGLLFAFVWLAVATSSPAPGAAQPLATRMGTPILRWGRRVNCLRGSGKQELSMRFEVRLAALPHVQPSCARI
jgi:hypothetical protein